MKKINYRQKRILELISRHKEISSSQIEELLNSVTKMTVTRDLNFLLGENYIEKHGKGPAVRYREKNSSKILRYFDPDEYFKKNTDGRVGVLKSFNFDVFENIKDFFSSEEMEKLEKLNAGYKERIPHMSSTILKKEYERLTIDLSWKSSQIEGNTYSILETEALIKERIEAEGHNKEEGIMILNHKNALDYILKKKKEFEKIDLFDINKIHRLLTANLHVKEGFRNATVGITGTTYRPLGSKVEIQKALDMLLKTIHSLKNPFSKALVATFMISYIQPFEDGNKRTARLISNGILIANNICPLSFRGVDNIEYKKGLILFYEQNSARYFKELFIKQFEFAVNEYFLGL